MDRFSSDFQLIMVPRGGSRSRSGIDFCVHLRFDFHLDLKRMPERPMMEKTMPGKPTMEKTMTENAMPP